MAARTPAGGRGRGCRRATGRGPAGRRAPPGRAGGTAPAGRRDGRREPTRAARRRDRGGGATDRRRRRRSRRRRRRAADWRRRPRPDLGRPPPRPSRRSRRARAPARQSPTRLAQVGQRPSRAAPQIDGDVARLERERVDRDPRTPARRRGTARPTWPPEARRRRGSRPARRQVTTRGRSWGRRPRRRRPGGAPRRWRRWRCARRRRGRRRTRRRPPGCRPDRSAGGHSSVSVGRSSRLARVRRPAPTAMRSSTRSTTTDTTCGVPSSVTVTRYARGPELADPLPQPVHLHPHAHGSTLLPDPPNGPDPAVRFPPDTGPPRCDHHPMTSTDAAAGPAHPTPIPDRARARRRRPLPRHEDPRRPLRRLVLHRGPHHRHLLPAQLPDPGPAEAHQHRLLPHRRGRAAGRLPGVQALPTRRHPGITRVEPPGGPRRPGAAVDRRRRGRPRGRARAWPAHLAVSERHLNRVLGEQVGAGPIALARAQRAQTARVLIETTDLPFAQVAFAAGFASIRQFNDTVREVFATAPRPRSRRGEPAPTAERPHDRRARRVRPGAITVRLPVRRRSTPTTCGRSSRLGPSPASRRSTATRTDDRSAAPRSGGHRADARSTTTCGRRSTSRDVRDLATAVTRARRLLDLDADPLAIDGALGRRPALRDLVRGRPGPRSPGVGRSATSSPSGPCSASRSPSPPPARSPPAWRRTRSARRSSPPPTVRLDHPRVPDADHPRRARPAPTSPCPEHEPAPWSAWPPRLADGTIVLDPGADRDGGHARAAGAPRHRSLDRVVHRHARPVGPRCLPPDRHRRAEGRRQPRHRRRPRRPRRPRRRAGARGGPTPPTTSGPRRSSQPVTPDRTPTTLGHR